MREIISLNEDWLFEPNNKKNLTKTKKTPKNCVKISLPHSLSSYALGGANVTQTKMWYKKTFKLDEKYAGKCLFVKIGGAMQSCTLYLNGKVIGDVKGGYTPFCIDVTSDIRLGKNNTLVARLSNEDDDNIPPGAPLSKSKTQYFGGLYRNVELIIKDKVNFSEGCYDKDNFGGTYIYDKNVSSERSTIVATYKIDNGDKAKKKLTIIGEIFNMKGDVCANVSESVEVGKKKSQVLAMSFDIDKPELWTIDCPYLYVVKLQIKDGEEIKDSLTIRHGIKSVECDHRGFTLNDRKVVLRGVNRIQQFPIVGIAVSENAEYRDAYKIKRGGFNIVRLSGGGNSSAFLDACDELGLLVIDCLPSEPFAHKGIFLDRVNDNIRVMARRDRNHACIAMWEPFIGDISYKNAGASDNFFVECKATLLAELSGDKSQLIAGDTAGRKAPQELDFDAPYAENNAITNEWHLDTLHGRKGLIKSYGDVEFGAEHSTLSVERGACQGAMLLQAWDYQVAHNRNMSNGSIMGDIIANNIDYTRPFTPKNSKNYSGIMDEYRLPKYSFYFFKSQDSRPSQRMIYAPTLWNDKRITTLPIFSNCQSVRLYINDRLIGEQSKDIGVADDYTAYIAQKKKRKNKSVDNNKVDFWAINDLKTRYPAPNKYAKFAMENMYNGNNANYLEHSPFTFKDITYEEGCVRVEGLDNGVVVCKQEINTPRQASAIDIKVDYSARALATDDKDFVFCYARIVDDNGTIVVDACEEISCIVEGGSVIGKAKARSVDGISSFLIKANKNAEKVLVTANAGKLTGQTVALKIAYVEKETL